MSDGDHHEQDPDRRGARAGGQLSPRLRGKTTTTPASILTTEHCTAVERTFDHDRSHYKSEAAFQVAGQKAVSLCRQDKHQNGGVEFGSRLSSRR